MSLLSYLNPFSKPVDTSTPAPTLGNPNARVTFGELVTRADAETMMGFLQILPDPDPILRDTGQDIQAYRELLSDPHLGAVIDTRKDAVRELEWQLDRGKGARSREVELIQTMLDELDMYQVITEILDAPLFGRQPLEVMWQQREVDDNPVIWLDGIVGKPPEWFACTTDNEWRFLSKTMPTGVGVAMPPKKLIVATHDSRYTNPYGVAILGRCFWPVTFGKGDMKLLVMLMEKYGQPWLKMVHEDNAATDFVDDLLEKGAQMVHDAVIAMPRSAEVEVIPNGQKGNADMFIQFIELCQSLVSKAILGHAAAADTTPGKLGNEEGAMSAKWGRAASDKRLVEGVMNEAIRWAWELNFGESAGEPPTFTFYEEEDVDQATAQRDQLLYQIGWRPTLEYIQKTYGFEAKDFVMLGGSTIAFDTVGGIQAIAKLAMDYEARLISRTAALTVAINVYKVPEDVAHSMFAEVLPPAPSTPPPGGAAFAEGDDPPSSPDPNQAVIDKQVSQGAPAAVADELTAEVIRLLDGAGGYPAAIEAMKKAFPKMSSVELEDDLVRRLNGAELTGRASIEGEDDA